MKNLTQKRRKWKRKVTERRKAAKDMVKDTDMKVEFIQALIPLGLSAVNEMLQKEVESLAGIKHKHGKISRRWGSQNGSIYLRDQKIPIEVPRVRNKQTNAEVGLSCYQKLQEPYNRDEGTFKKLLNGISMHRYRESAELVPEVFGLSASNMSGRFKKAAAGRLRYLQMRRLDNHDFIAVFLDGKRFAEEGIIIALGITIEGRKIILGIEQMNTENHRAMTQFFDKLVERGLRFEKELLFIVDGSKGIIKAIKQKFNGSSVIQRCQWHKRENVVSYLSRSQQMVWRKKLQAAYAKTTYTEAKSSLLKLSGELEGINQSAANSLREGLEETLTICRLKLTTELRRSFSTTNCIESVLSQVEQYTQRVDRWRDGAHMQRWVAAGLLELEPRLRKVNGFRYLKLLRNNIKEELGRVQRKENTSLQKQQLVPMEI